MDWCCLSRTKEAETEKGLVLVCGAGNAAHVFIPYFSKQGYLVNVFAPFQDEADRLRNKMVEKGGITVHDRCDPSNIMEYKGHAMMVSNKAQDVVPSADFIIFALPSFALEPMLTQMKPHLKQGAIIFVMPGQGGTNFVAKQVLKEELASSKVSVAGVIPMPINCRITEWGEKVELAALKATYDIGSLPASAAPKAAEALSGLLGKPVRPLGNYVCIALHAANPAIHPPRLWRLFQKHVADHVYKENPLFYEDWDDETSEFSRQYDAERLAIWKAVCAARPETLKESDVPDLKTYIENIYADQIKDKSTLTSVFSTNVGFAGFRCPMKEVDGGFTVDFGNRYFTEDIPEGVCMYKGIADIVGVSTPLLDQMVCFFQSFMGKEYIKEGKLQPAGTKSPQAFGITTIDALLD